MFDEAAYFIFRALLILTVLVVVVGIPLGETLIRNKTASKWMQFLIFILLCVDKNWDW